jgi:hypothetical protein
MRLPVKLLVLYGEFDNTELAPVVVVAVVVALRAAAPSE